MTIREAIRTLQALSAEDQGCDLVDLEELWPMLGLIVRDPDERELSKTRTIKMKILADAEQPGRSVPPPSPAGATPRHE